MGSEKHIVIAGAGPAGSSLAIRLALGGHRVSLVERAVFPREKLCGEFISPECLAHFRELGVLPAILAAGGSRIRETRFYAMSGRHAAVPSSWFGGGAEAISLSRARMDTILLERARELGVDIREGTSVSGIAYGDGRLSGLTIRDESGTGGLSGDVFIDATGRSAVIRKLVERETGRKQGPAGTAKLIGFKAHFSDAGVRGDACEIYSFPGGYGGLSPIENGLANLCFLVKTVKAREHENSADALVRELIFQNPRAKEMLSGAKKAGSWLAVAVAGFGSRDAVIAGNVFGIGDAAAFIDPFTGSGMLMAMESAELLATAIENSAGETDIAAAAYKAMHAARFRKRLALSGLLRQTALNPLAARLAVAGLAANGALRRLIASGTRGTRPAISPTDHISDRS